ncbi:MAG: hypothetical protein NTU47_16995 [Ignavibacteriales bacterium]|nr:hypothetical protein [Ignavibacteriales bacterium]
MNCRLYIARFAFLFGLITLCMTHILSQSIYLPVAHEVYPFLKRLEARGLLPEYRDAAKPLSRRVLAMHLKTLAGAVDRMTEVERDEYEFLKGEFNYELSTLAGDREPSEIRWHVISETFPGGILNLEPNLLFGQTNIGKDNVRTRGQGAKFYGYVFDDIGYYFNFVDNREVGTGINFGRVHTPEPGVLPTNNLENLPRTVLEYNTTEVQFTFHIGAFSFSLEKMQNIWGLERNGNLAFSNKAPSYPQIKLRVPVTNWMDFIYLHAELNSNIIDSTRSYFLHSSSIADYYRQVDRTKYMAAHMVEFTPVHGVDVSIGESVVYSDRGPLLIYLIPIMFFKSAEHYNLDKDNIQWFGNLDLNLIRNVNVYGSLFIDDLSLDKILIAEEHPNYFGYSIGFQTYDVLLKNIEFNAEYTRINPWVYTNKITPTDFTNNGYVMGHWMGQNADNLMLDLSYRPVRSVLIGASMQVYRKGGLKDISYQYTLPASPFLYGPLHEERAFGMHARYQFMRDGFLDVRVGTRKTNDEALNIHGDRKLEFSMTARYGLW